MIQGLQLNLSEFPVQTSAPPPLKFNSKETAATDRLILELLQKNTIVECEHEEGEFISRIFLRCKSNGLWRLILDLSSYNAYISVNRFKMDTLTKTLTLITPFCHFCSLDLSDAYLVLRVHPLFYKHLHFVWCGRLMQFVCMPFRPQRITFSVYKIV